MIDITNIENYDYKWYLILHAFEDRNPTYQTKVSVKYEAPNNIVVMYLDESESMFELLSVNSDIDGQVTIKLYQNGYNYLLTTRSDMADEINSSKHTKNLYKKFYKVLDLYNTLAPDERQQLINFLQENDEKEE